MLYHVRKLALPNRRGPGSGGASSIMAVRVSRSLARFSVTGGCGTSGSLSVQALAVSAPFPDGYILRGIIDVLSWKMNVMMSA